MVEDLEPEPRPEEPPRSDRLDSWKEIATHLGRSVRTVQLWEKEEGLPVHRHLHKKQGSVYAYRSEVDAWWTQHRQELVNSHPSNERNPRLNFRTVSSTFLVLVLLTAVISLVAPRSAGRKDAGAWSRPPAVAPGSEDPLIARELGEITTASLEAYRYYSEGLRLWREAKSREALVLFERAVEVDPDFPMANYRVGNAYAGQGRMEEAQPHFERALASLDRVTPRERLFIEAGCLLWQGEGSYGRVLEVLQKGAQLFPDDEALTLTLAITYSELERPSEAIQLVEEVKARGVSHAFLENQYMFDQVAAGEFEKPRQSLENFIRSTPEESERARALITLAKNYLYWGKYGEALDTVRQAESLRVDIDPGSSIGVRWLLGVSSEDFPLAYAAADELTASPDPYLRWLGFTRKAVGALYAGRSRDGLAFVEKAVDSHPSGGLVRARALPLAAHVLLETGDWKKALSSARRATAEGRGDLTEWEGLFFASLAEARLGRMREADRIAEELRQVAESLPTEKEKRRHHHLLGELALARDDTAGAIPELVRAESMLLPRGYVSFPRYSSEHVPIWYSLAQAYLDAGREEEASRWFRRVVDSPAERTDWPIPFVRSYYFLGRIHESRGETEAARQSYRRFFDFWKDGDLDRDRVLEVEKKLRVLDPSHLAQPASVSQPY